MSFLRELVPGLTWGQPWSDRLPWRWHEQADQFALTRAYDRVPPPTWNLSSDSADATLLFAGDLALHRFAAGDTPARVFGGVHEAFASADFRCVNLESVLTNHADASGTIGRFLKAPPSTVECLQYLGIDVASVANNHALDFGSIGFTESLNTLGEAGISTCGVDAKHQETGIAGATLHVVNGVRVGIIAATDHFGGMKEPGQLSPVWLDTNALRAAVQTLNRQCDIVVIQLHWGYEYVMYPLNWHRNFARELVELGADIVCCHHAHVIMGVEQWNNGIIAHGLGNFWFGTQGKGHPASRFGLLLRVSVNKRGVITATAVPVCTDGAFAVHVDQNCAPGFDRLCVNLGSDAALGAVEQSRVYVEIAGIMRHLHDRLTHGDARGVLERQHQLSAPRDQWLLLQAVDGLGHEWSPVVDWLLHFRNASRDTIEGGDMLLPPALDRIARHADSRRLAGRWP